MAKFFVSRRAPCYGGRRQPSHFLKGGFRIVIRRRKPQSSVSTTAYAKPSVCIEGQLCSRCVAYCTQMEQTPRVMFRAHLRPSSNLNVHLMYLQSMACCPVLTRMRRPVHWRCLMILLAAETHYALLPQLNSLFPDASPRMTST